jgi:ATP-dependent Clp protease ATP-binding subunit ClpC
MSAELDDLLRQAARNPDQFWSLVDALRETAEQDPGVLAGFARSSNKLARRAAAAAGGGNANPYVIEVLAALASDPEFDVRQELAYACKNHPHWPMAPALERLLADADSNTRQAAAWAAQQHPSLVPNLLDRLSAEDDTWVRSEVAHVLAGCPPQQVVASLLDRIGKDPDAGVQQACATSLEKHLATLGNYPAGLERPRGKALHEIRQRVHAFTYGSYPSLKNWLNQELAGYVDLDGLTEYGTLLTYEADAGLLPRAHGYDAYADAVLAILEGAPPRAVVLLGESGAGKTALAQELVYRLRQHPGGPVHVLRMTPQDFMVNTRYIGEWETRVRNLVNAVKPPRRILLYVPNLEELAWMGTWAKSDANVASNLAPYIERGELTLLGESSVEAFRKGLGANRSLRRLFHAVELPPADASTTQAILRAVATEAGVDIADPVLARLSELAEYFAAGSVQPGRSVGLLRKVIGLTEDRPGPINEQDILSTLASSTGIPAELLDDRISLKHADVRAFFEARVMGQAEAVEAIVDLVTLVKAGLNDPGKPFGVFLFVGPTGVGKTELARALAEHLFGDAGRLVRFDMSEYATYEAYERLIGHAVRGEPGQLTSIVRERPFAVILLDEIEKAHPNIYNLCLQLFDAGRLTDAAGRTVDFRRTIIILTSNVGSTIATGPPVGLARETPPPPGRDAILRELGRWFRPEFLNRLDRIVTFRPLATETAQRIAQRELVRVLERAGITRRHLAVDVDPSVLPLLLREGYSPAFGARPLKRTVERLVLLPLARAIAEGNVPPGSLVRLAARRDHVAIEVEPAESADPAPPSAQRAGPVAERAEHLLERVHDLQGRSAPLAGRKSELLARSSAPGFWDDPAASQVVFDEVYRLDGILASLTELEKRARAEADLVARRRHSERDLAILDARLDALDSRCRHLEFLVGCRDGRALGDALVTLSLSSRQGSGLDAVPTLARMYLSLAAHRGLEAQVLDDRRGDDPVEDTITLMLSGPGAFALLSGEAGLHSLSRSRKADAGRPDRDVVRVEVLPAAAGEPAWRSEDLQLEVRPLGGVRGRLLAHVNHEVRIFHTPSMLSACCCCEGTRAEAIDRARTLLWIRLQAHATELGPRATVVRRYRLGPSALVRDHRTGRSTGRLDQVLAGHLDLFLLPATETAPPATERPASM